MKIEHVKQCQFHEWYHKFEKITFKSAIIPISNTNHREFITWLNKGSFNISSSAFPVQYNTSIEEELDPDNAFTLAECADDEANESDVTKQQWYEPLKQQVEEIINTQLGGSAFPKLNWSSPRDAVWLTYNNSLQCKTLEEIILLLKSSDFISSDLNEPFELCETQNGSEEDPHNELSYYLILRKFYDNIAPSMEFRCIVSHNQIVGISQRSLVYYDFLEDIKDKVKNLITDFYKQHILNQFSTHSFVFDVYIDRRDKVWLVDFNPFGRRTDSLLFSWDEVFIVHLLIQQKYSQNPSLYSSLIEGDQSEFMDFRLADHSSTSASYLQNAIFGMPNEEISVATPEGIEMLIKLQQQQAVLAGDSDIE